MTPLEEVLSMKLTDDIEASDGLAEEGQDFLNSLEEIVKKVEDDPGSID